MYFHENFAADSGNIEKFNFHVATTCWGNFEESFTSNQLILGITCKGRSKSGTKHAGSTLLAYDGDGDGDKDLLIGDVSYDNLIYLTNGGTKNYADMISQDTLFPSYDTPVDVRFFPGAFLLDMDNDGLNDLVVTPNGRGTTENWQSTWFYKNKGTNPAPVF